MAYVVSNIGQSKHAHHSYILRSTPLTLLLLVDVDVYGICEVRSYTGRVSISYYEASLVCIQHLHPSTWSGSVYVAMAMY